MRSRATFIGLLGPGFSAGEPRPFGFCPDPAHFTLEDGILRNDQEIALPLGKFSVWGISLHLDKQGPAICSVPLTVPKSIQPGDKAFFMPGSLTVDLGHPFADWCGMEAEAPQLETTSCFYCQGETFTEQNRCLGCGAPSSQSARRWAKAKKGKP